MKYRLYPLSERAIVIDFGNESISEAKNELVQRACRSLVVSPFPGLVDIAPAYSSLTVYYDPLAVERLGERNVTASETVKTNLSAALSNLKKQADHESEAHVVPVCYTGEHAPDLASVAELRGLTPAEVIDIHCSRTYRVYMLGFLPGFAYMGSLDPRIEVPRLSTPRMRVLAGSVGLAGTQTGIYPFDSPGGWQIIGRTPIELFSPEQEPPSLFKAGDKVKFRPISVEEYNTLRAS